MIYKSKKEIIIIKVKVVNKIKKKIEIILKIIRNNTYLKYLIIAQIGFFWKLMFDFSGFGFDFWLFYGKIIIMGHAVYFAKIWLMKLKKTYFKEVIKNKPYKRGDIVICMDSYEERDLDSVSDLELKKNYLNKKQEVYSLNIEIKKKNPLDNETINKFLKAIQEYYELKEEISKHNNIIKKH